MYTLGEVGLRPLESEDMDLMYAWDADPELNMLAGWSRRKSRATYAKWLERRVEEPAKDMQLLGVTSGGQLVGYVQLAMIDEVNRTAAVGIVIGEKSAWGRGVGSAALRLLLDYAFTVFGLERVYAEVYAFNTRSQRLFERVGFVREGVLRQHEMHNGARQDLVAYGILRAEFYQRYETLFRLPDAATKPAEENQ